MTGGLTASRWILYVGSPCEDGNEEAIDFIVELSIWAAESLALYTSSKCAIDTQGIGIFVRCFRTTFLVSIHICYPAQICCPQPQDKSLKQAPVDAPAVFSEVLGASMIGPPISVYPIRMAK